MVPSEPERSSRTFRLWTIDKKLQLFRSLALSFFVCGVLVYVLIIVYDKKEEMDLESNLNIQVLLPNPTGNLPSGFAGHGRWFWACYYGKIKNYIDEHGDSHLVATHDIHVDLVENLYGERNPAAFHTHLCRLTQAWCYKLIGKSEWFERNFSVQ